MGDPGCPLGAHGLPELVEHLRTGIDAWNRYPRRPVAGCTPAEAWERDAKPIRTVPEERQRWMILTEQRRTVQREGVRLGGLYFTAPELTGREGEGRGGRPAPSQPRGAGPPPR